MATVTDAPAAPAVKRKWMVSLDLPVIKNQKGQAVQYAPSPFVVDAVDEAAAKAEYLRARGFNRPENDAWLRETWKLKEKEPLPFVVEAY